MGIKSTKLISLPGGIFMWGLKILIASMWVFET